MGKRVTTIQQGLTVEDAAKMIMEGNFNHLPVVSDEGRLVGIITAWDIAKAIALGADGAVIATSEMVALECIRCGKCESGPGCPRGIATTDPKLSTAFSVEWATQRLINLFHSYSIQLQEILWRLGMKSIKELVGRADLLVHQDYIDKTASPALEPATTPK